MTEEMFIKVMYPSYNISWGHIAQKFWKTRLLFPPPPQRQHVLIRVGGFSQTPMITLSRESFCQRSVSKVKNEFVCRHKYSKKTMCCHQSITNPTPETGLELYHRNCPSWAHWGWEQPAEKKQSLDLDLPDMFVRSKIITSKLRWCWLSVSLPTTCQRVNGTQSRAVADALVL